MPKKASNHHANIPLECTVLHCITLASTRAIIRVLGDQHVASRCFPGGYNVKLYISRGRLAWWLLAFLCCSTFMTCSFYISSFSFLVYRWFCTVSLNRECYARHIVFCKFMKQDLRQCEIISGCIYWHFEQFLNLCWMLSIAANKACI